MSDLFHADRRKNRDRRAAVRTVASGHVEISVDIPMPSVIDAELIESSATGFRASHDSNALEPGLNVRFQSPLMSGYARIIWTHVLHGQRVSGFLCLTDIK